MKFLVDAQLPRKLANGLQAAGHVAIHTMSLPGGNRTPDEAIIDVASREQRVVVTKDSDFVNSFTLYGRPERLLLVSTGNIANDKLEEIFLPNLSDIVNALSANRFVELTRDNILVHA